MSAQSRIVMKRGTLQVAHVVFAAALLVRIVALVALASSPYLRPTGGDMLFYDQWAQRILHGQFTDHLAFYGLPLYAYWLAGIYKLFGLSPFVPLAFQALAEAGTAALLYKIADAIFKTDARVNVAGAIAATGWILFVPAQAYSIVLMPTAFGVFVFWFAIWQIVRADDISTRRLFLTALLLGVTAMAVANVLFAAPLLAVAAFVKARTSARHVALKLGAIVCGIVIGTSPCWIHNRFVAHDPAFLSAHSGINFWIGNNPDATGYPHFPDLRAGQAEMLADSISIAESAAGHALKRSEVSAYWSQRTRESIAADPARWLRIVLRKIGNYWNAFEYDDLSVIARLREEGTIFPGLHFGLVAALALPGVAFALRWNKRARWIAAAVVLHLLSILPMFVTERYRIVAVPGLLIFAAWGMVELWSWICRAAYRPALAFVASVAVAAYLVSAPRLDASLWAFAAYHTGIQALEANDLPLARARLAAAHAYTPRNAEVSLALGNLALRENNPEAARRHYSEALAINPHHKSALNNLGVMALNDHDFAAAKTLFERALREDPRNAKSHFLLARALLGVGDVPAATRELDSAIDLDPDQSAFRDLRATLTRDR